MHCTHLILKAREFMNEQQQVLRVITKPQSSNHKDVTQQVILVCKKKKTHSVQLKINALALLCLSTQLESCILKKKLFNEITHLFLNVLNRAEICLSKVCNHRS